MSDTSAWEFGYVCFRGCHCALSLSDVVKCAESRFPNIINLVMRRHLLVGNRMRSRSR
jgi:hypothetical protein